MRTSADVVCNTAPLCNFLGDELGKRASPWYMLHFFTCGVPGEVECHTAFDEKRAGSGAAQEEVAGMPCAHA